MNLHFFKKRLFQKIDHLKKIPTIWVHCSSMGETNLSEPLIKELLEERRENIIISTFTDTGYENAKKKYNNIERIEVIYFPLDIGFLLERIFQKIDFKLLILVETEIWPNFIKKAKKYGKIIIVNGRISDRSFPRYKKIKWILRKTLEKISAIYTQTYVDRDRFIELGSEKEKVENLGNMKFCIDFEKYTDEEKKELKAILKVGDKKILILGSTRENEEKIILEELKKNPELLKTIAIIIVPRHLTRIEEVKNVIEKLDYTWKEFTELEENFNLGRKEEILEEKNQEIIIVNKMGVLRKFYSIGDCVFVGGTLVNIGGHSLLEPLFYGKTPIYGKYLQNIKTISKELNARYLGYELKENSEFVLRMKEILELKSENIYKKKVEIEKLFFENKNVVKNILGRIKNILNY